VNTTVSLVSSNPSVATIPATVTVPAGSASATFGIQTNVIAQTTDIVITAASGGNSQTATLTILPAATQLLFSDAFQGPPGPAPQWTTQLGSWSVDNGVINGTSAPGTYGYTSSGSTDWTDYTVQGRVQFPAGAYGGGIGGRVNAATGAHYGVWVYPEGSPGGSSLLKVLKFSNWTTWTGTPLAQATLTGGVGTGGHTVRVIFQGNRIQVFYDGIQVIDAIDNGFGGLPAYTTGGISLDLWSNTSAAMKVDDIGATAP
jgi:hypothetical protein